MFLKFPTSIYWPLTDFEKSFKKSPAATLVYLEDEQLMLEWAFRKMSPSLKEHFSYLLPKAAASLDF